VVSWSWNPWQERPRQAWAAVAFATGSFALLEVASHVLVLSLVLALAVAGTLAPLLVPQRCRVDQDGVAVCGPFGWERRRWQALRRAAPRSGGVLVSPFTRPQRLDRFRALFLPLPAAERESLATALRAHFERHGL
jgi:hypothetical protein